MPAGLRSTFRPPSDGLAWQRQLRDRHAHEGAPPVPLTLSTARVEPIAKAFAAQVILKYEWLGTMVGSHHHYGIFFGPFCAGVRMAHRAYAVDRHAIGLLARGACVHWAPTGTNSRLVAWTVRLLARDSGLKILLAYADSDAGEIGTIYQACGWAYLGRGQVSKQYVAPNSRIWNNRTFTGWCARVGVGLDTGRARLVAAGWRVERANAKHRYAVLVGRPDPALASRLESMKQPYPKRVGSAGSGTPGLQPGRGGATPTPTLAGA